MSIFRIHIIKIAVLSLFVTGLLLVSWPGLERLPAGESVASWLFQLRTDTENPDVNDKIYSLRSQNGDISLLLRKASAIISDHADDFNLPVESGSSSDDDIYNTLLLNWSLHQKNVPIDAVIITDRQSHLIPANGHTDLNVTDHNDRSIPMLIGINTYIIQILEYGFIIISPMTGGFAIGAP